MLTNFFILLFVLISSVFQQLQKSYPVKTSDIFVVVSVLWMYTFIHVGSTNVIFDAVDFLLFKRHL